MVRRSQLVAFDEDVECKPPIVSGFEPALDSCVISPAVAERTTFEKQPRDVVRILLEERVAESDRCVNLPKERGFVTLAVAAIELHLPPLDHRVEEIAGWMVWVAPDDFREDGTRLVETSCVDVVSSKPDQAIGIGTQKRPLRRSGRREQRSCQEQNTCEHNGQSRVSRAYKTHPMPLLLSADNYRAGSRCS